MPFCPECKYEYRPDIKTCPDCDVELVDSLEAEAPQGPPPKLVPVASFPFDAPAQEAKIRLESHGIQSVLTNEIMAQTNIVFAFADGGVKVLVREEDAAEALAILGEES